MSVTADKPEPGGVFKYAVAAVSENCLEVCREVGREVPQDAVPGGERRPGSPRGSLEPLDIPIPVSACSCSCSQYSMSGLLLAAAADYTIGSLGTEALAQAEQPPATASAGQRGQQHSDKLGEPRAPRRSAEPEQSRAEQSYAAREGRDTPVWRKAASQPD